LLEASAKVSVEAARAAPEVSTRAFAEQLIDTVSSLVVVMDRAGIIVYFNRACEKATGYTAAEVLGRPFFDLLLQPADIASVRAVFDSLLAGMFPNTHDNHWVAKDGSLRWIHWDNTAHVGADGNVEQVIGTGIDLTENVALARALDRSEARLRQWIRHLPDVVFVHRAGKILFVNDALLAALEWERPEALAGAVLGQLVAPGDLESFEACDAELLHEGDAHPPRELHLLDVRGRPVPTEVVCVRTVFDGQPATLCVARDLTARHERTTRMFQVDRTMMLGSVAAGIGHEINNPLTFVMGNIELVSQSLAKLASATGVPLTVSEALRAQEGALGDALQGVQRIAAIVRDLKGLTRSAETPGASVAVEPVLDSLLKVAAHELKHRARVVRVYGGVPRVLGSDARVAQIFLNLLLNAAQAIPPGDAEHQTVTLHTRVEGDWVEVLVSDTGVGMTKELLSRVFEPFFTTKRGEGTGLGLSITRQLVLSLGGTLTAESEPGVGSTLRVRLPIAPADPASRSDSAPPPPPLSLLRARVLVVDDELQVADVMVRMLRGKHDVTSVSSGVAALELLTSAAPPPDVIVCDVMMPAMTGIELYQHIEARRPELARRFVFITGGTFTPQSEAFLARVSRPVLMKPFDWRAVLAAIAAVRGLARSEPQSFESGSP
jgi:PAS domain S-box-containing protein